MMKGALAERHILKKKYIIIRSYNGDKDYQA